MTVATGALLLLGTASAYLGESGSTSAAVTPVPGSPSDGSLALVTPLSPSVYNAVGQQVGVALAKIQLASANANAIRVEVDWTSANVAPQVLHNPNVQIWVGLYHIIHDGACNTAVHSLPIAIVTVTDGSTYCMALDGSSTGGDVSSNGELLLSLNQIGNYLSPHGSPSGTLNACTTSTAAETLNSAGFDTDPWCQPASVTDSNQRLLYAVATIVTPGGAPQGQQPLLSSMSFFTSVHR